MRPTVFLSHSKHDRTFIERLANDLRLARIAVWYDEWEIPPGESFRRKIFEEGIPNSDLFFVYLSAAAADSYWVTRELDAAFIRDAESQGGFLAIFVDSDETRNRLPLDVRALHSPVLSPTAYDRPLWQLIARAWESAGTRRVKHASDEAKIELLTLQKQNAELEAKVARLEARGLSDAEHTLARLASIPAYVGDEAITLRELFGHLAPLIATGSTAGRIRDAASKYGATSVSTTTDPSGATSIDVVSALVIHGLVYVQNAPELIEDWFYLTDLGITVAARLT